MQRIKVEFMLFRLQKKSFIANRRTPNPTKHLKHCGPTQEPAGLDSNPSSATY